MRKLTAIISTLLFTGITASAQERFSIEAGLVGGLSFDQGAAIPEYGIELTAGAAPAADLFIYGGIGGLTSTAYGTTSAPLFARIRYEFNIERVFPFIGIDLGYAFLIHTSKETIDVARVNEEPLDYAWYEKGYRTRNEFLDKAGEEDDLYRFENGSRQYLEDKCSLYGREGLFADLSLGTAIPVGLHKVRFGISAGMAQYTYGRYLRTYDNKLIGYTTRSNLGGTPGALLDQHYTWTDRNGQAVTEASYEQRRGRQVLISGSEPFLKRFRPTLNLRIGLIF